MDPALQLLNQGLAALNAIDHTRLTNTELGAGVLAVQKVIDTLRTSQARLVHTADTRRIWADSGHRDIASWLAANAKTSVSAAKRQARLGKALDNTPALADAIDNGDLTPDTADALLPTLDSNHTGNIADLIDACTGATPNQARDAGTTFQEINKPADETEKEREHRRRQRRHIRFSDNGDGMTRIDGLLPVLDARYLRDVLNHITGKPTTHDDRTSVQQAADALIQLAVAYSTGTVTGGREAPTVIVTIDIDVLEARTPGVGHTSTGDIIPAEIVRRMCTNANIVRLLTSDSRPLDIGRAQRLATNDQYRALVARDGGCRMLDCTIPPNWCQVDHIHEWTAQNGPTDLHLLVLWCVYHHSFRHRPDVQLHGDADNLSITMPDGRTVPLPARGPTSHQHAA